MKQMMFVDLILRFVQFFFALIAFSCVFGAIGNRLVWGTASSFAAIVSILVWVYSLMFCLGLHFEFKVQSSQLSILHVLVALDSLLALLLFASGVSLATSDIHDSCERMTYERIAKSYDFSCSTFNASIAFTFLCFFAFLGGLSCTIYKNMEALLPPTAVDFVGKFLPLQEDHYKATESPVREAETSITTAKQPPALEQPDPEPSPATEEQSTPKKAPQVHAQEAPTQRTTNYASEERLHVHRNSADIPRHQKNERQIHHHRSQRSRAKKYAPGENIMRPKKSPRYEIRECHV